MLTSDFGNLHLLEKLADGGTAEVYAALGRQGPDQPRLVAVKRLRHALVMDPTVVRTFMKEAWLGRWLRHPNLVRVLGAGRDAGRPFIIMEHLDGANLRALSRDRLFATADVIELAHAVARALAYLHRALGPDGRPLGLVHRDVTPNHVFVTCSGDVKLLDLGAARMGGPSGERAIDPLPGSLAFMAPEDLAGADVDHRADQFSLGVVLYELVTGERLFACCHRPPRELLEERRRRVSDRVLRERRVPRALICLLMKLLSPRRAERFASTDELVRAFEALRTRRSVSARSVDRDAVLANQLG